MKHFWVYILANSHNTSLYTGMTNNLERRIAEHKSHVIPGFSATYKTDRLIYSESYDTAADAIAREKQIKSWRRSKKDDLIALHNPQWRDLSDDWHK